MSVLYTKLRKNENIKLMQMKYEQTQELIEQQIKITRM